MSGEATTTLTLTDQTICHPSCRTAPDLGDHDAAIYAITIVRNLHLVFDAIGKTRGVYLFDEFDALGGERGASNDVGEARRALNSFLQFVEEDASEGLLLAATNHAGLLDRALFRRFNSDDLIRAIDDICSRPCRPERARHGSA